MAKYNVLSSREMESRCEIYLERYVKDIAVEGRLTLEIAKTTIFPAAIKYQHQLASTALALKELGKGLLHDRARRIERAGQRSAGCDADAGKGDREPHRRIDPRSRGACA